MLPIYSFIRNCYYNCLSIASHWVKTSHVTTQAERLSLMVKMILVVFPYAADLKIRTDRVSLLFLPMWMSQRRSWRPSTTILRKSGPSLAFLHHLLHSQTLHPDSDCRSTQYQRSSYAFLLYISPSVLSLLQVGMQLSKRAKFQPKWIPYIDCN